jgi:hypothetical protein
MVGPASVGPASVSVTRSPAAGTTGRPIPDIGTGVITTARDEGDSTGPPAA